MSLYSWLVTINNLSYWQLFSSFTCGYAAYYFYKVVHRPILIAGEGTFKSKLIKDVGVLREHFYPTFWAFHAHLQTILRVLLKSKPYIPYEREVLNTLDSGQVGLDWVENDQENLQFPDPQKRPTVIILPGITGCSDANYVRTVIMEATGMGWRSVVFNNRGLGKTDLKTPRTFCACNGEDLEFVLNHISTKYKDSPLLVFAVSLGGVIFTNYLSMHGKPKVNIIAAILISVPWDSNKTTSSLEKPVNWLLYNRFIVNKLKVLIAENLHVFQKNIHQLPYKIEDVMKSRSIREFDEHFTAKSFGFPSCHEYYTESSLSLKPLENIQLPMLFLNSRDDPFAPGESIPFERIKKNPNMAMIITDYGGHIGFIEGLTVNSRAFVERLFKQFASSMVKNMEESQ